MGKEIVHLNTYKTKLKKKTGFESEVKMRDFSITVDEPKRVGGTNKGPSPVEVLLGALGACLDFTGTIVAKEMEHELKNFELEIEGDPRGVMGKAGVPIGFQSIRVKVSEIDGIPEEKIPEFLKTIQERCPVDNTLEKGVSVEITR